MRVAFFLWSLSEGKGGAERAGAELANHLCRNGHEAIVFMNGMEALRTSYPLLPQVRREYNSTALLTSREGQAELRRQLRAHDPDVFVVMASTSTMLAGVGMAAGTGVPLVISERSDPCRGGVGALEQTGSPVGFFRRGTHTSAAGKIQRLPASLPARQGADYSQRLRHAGVQASGAAGRRRRPALLPLWPWAVLWTASSSIPCLLKHLLCCMRSFPTGGFRSGARVATGRAWKKRSPGWGLQRGFFCAASMTI